ncbi:hypothetical protein [Herbiconiux sp. L3-i23]|uniref:hypothetical protein n=1 Tax=Herbiconiux sp. L3-i23 TaxID=2905871 RepID=UPI0020737A5B|nr:hypothetical protein [Herbiconiux sp. L3-i23]
MYTVEPVEEVLPSIVEILDSWFASRARRVTGRRRERVESVAARLRRCVETESDRVATAGEKVLIAAERQFEPDGAVARALDCSALPEFLLVFVEDAWLPVDVQDRRVQISELSALNKKMARREYIDVYWSSCPVITLESALVRLRNGQPAWAHTHPSGESHHHCGP